MAFLVLCPVALAIIGQDKETGRCEKTEAKA